MNRYLPLLMTLALAACGGGGGGSNPTPTAASSTPTAKSAIGQNGNIDGTALKSTGPGPYPLNAATATLDPGTGPNNGGVSITDTAVPGTVSVTFDPNTNQITSMTYHQNGADHELLGLDGTTVNNPQSVPQITKEMISAAAMSLSPNQPIVTSEALSYSAFGVWANQFQGGPHDGVTAVGVFAAGSETPTAAVPTTGMASYTGDAAGYASVPKPAGDPHTNGTLNMAFDGNSAIGVNFGTGQVTSSFTNLHAVSMDSLATAVNLPDLKSTTGVLTGNAYTTDLTGSGGLTGGVAGKLYGPAAQETAGTFTAAGGGTTIIGAFGAKK